MLTILPSSPVADSLPIWVDLLAPSDEERAAAEKIVGSPLPTRESLSEIESSSRIRVHDGVLYMSVPSAAPRAPGEPRGQPIGFVLARQRLVTLRYTPLKAFDAVSKTFEDDQAAPKSGLEVFVALCEEIVDVVADGLEHLAAELGSLSTAAFDADDVKGRRAVRSNQILRVQLRTVGRLGDRLSEVRDSMVGLSRLIAFTTQMTDGWADPACKARLASLGQDIASLNDYDAQLFNKIQFLLDATVGLIGIAQNDIFKVLTIVSIVGIPPTLIASLYGMNFKNMPEYDWAFGYQYGLTMILLSAIIPIVWFKFKGWF